MNVRGTWSGHEQLLQSGLGRQAWPETLAAFPALPSLEPIVLSRIAFMLNRTFARNICSQREHEL